MFLRLKGYPRLFLSGLLSLSLIYLLGLSEEGSLGRIIFLNPEFSLEKWPISVLMGKKWSELFYF